MQILPTSFKAAALCLAALVTLAGAAGLHALAAVHARVPAPPLADGEAGCDLDATRLC